MNRAKRAPAGAALCALLLLAACDAAGVAPEIGARGPEVSALAVTPGAVSLDTLAVEEVGLRLALRAEPGDAPLARVAYAVQWQFACGSTALDASGLLDPTGDDGTYAADVPLPVTRGRRGAYRVTAWAVDAAGRASAPSAATFTLAGTNGGPPVIANIQAPATLRVPRQGSPVPLRFVVTVTDPDGVDDVARAEIITPGLGTVPLADREGTANPTACDGRYSITFNIPAGTPAGALPFAFRAYDRAGAVSETVPFTVTLEPGT